MLRWLLGRRQTEETKSVLEEQLEENSIVESQPARSTDPKSKRARKEKDDEPTSEEDSSTIVCSH